MEMLVLGHPSAERARVVATLTGAGHVVDVCHDGHWACAGMRGDCPLDATAVDVAVAVAEPGDRFDTQGIACAFRARVPVVAVGAAPDDPALDYTSASVPGPGGALLTAVEASATDASSHRAVIERALADHLRPGEHVGVHVERSSRRLDVQLTSDLDPERAPSIADIARTAARRHDPRATVIDVSVQHVQLR